MVTRTAKPLGTCSRGPGNVSYCATSIPAAAGQELLRSIDAVRRQAGDRLGRERSGIGARPDDHAGLRSRAAGYGFDILNGYSKDEKTWVNNSRVRGATLTLSDGQSFGIELPDVRDLNRFEFSRPVSTASIAIRVDSVYRGAKYADTAISELYPVFAD